jgi:uncharacterized protein
VIYYVDTSALVKRYYVEKGSSWVNGLFRSEHVLVTSKVAYAELLATLSRKERAGEVRATDFAQVTASFQQEWKEFVVVEVTDAVFADLLTVVRRNTLRGFDAIHLCSALWFRKRIKAEVRFVCADRGLLTAAKAEGFAIEDPEQREGKE